MLSNEYYNILDWHNYMTKIDINYDIDKVLDVVIASEIYKIKTNPDYYLYDVIISNLELIEKQCIRGNSPSNNY